MHKLRTIEDLAAEPRWERARILALPGRCRGDALGRWGENVERRFGAEGLARVRTRLGAPHETIASVLTDRDWLPVHAQVLVTEAIIDELFGGDPRALYPALLDDARANVGRVHRVLVRSLGAARALRQTPGAFAKVYERGTAEVAIDGHRARVVYRGSPLFANPTWRLLQLYGLQVLLELAGTPGTATGEDTGTDSFAALAAW